MSSQADSHASPIALQASAKEQWISVISGLNFTDLFVRLDPATWWLKMYQGYFQAMMGDTLEIFSGTWPKQGMMRNGDCYRLSSSELRTLEREYLSLLGIPYIGTPTATWKARTLRYRVGRLPNPAEIAKYNLWSTPIASNYRGVGTKERYEHRRKTHSQSLNEEVVHGSNDQSGGQLNPEFCEWLMNFPIGWT